MNKHEALIREISEEMAASSITSMHVNGDCETGQKIAIALYKEAARIAVKHMAEIARNAYLSSLGYSHEESASSCDMQCMIEFLKEQGLIPPAKTGKEVAGDE